MKGSRLSKTLNGKQGNCGHSCTFFMICPAVKPQKIACWGQTQTPATSGHPFGWRGNGPGRIPVAGLAALVGLAGHTHKQAFVALQDFKIVNYKAVVDFQAGKAHKAAFRFDGPDGNIQLHRQSGRGLLIWGLPVCRGRRLRR